MMHLVCYLFMALCSFCFIRMYHFFTFAVFSALKFGLSTSSCTNVTFFAFGKTVVSYVLQEACFCSTSS